MGAWWLQRTTAAPATCGGPYVDHTSPLTLSRCTSCGRTRVCGCGGGHTGWKACGLQGTATGREGGGGGWLAAGQCACQSEGAFQRPPGFLHPWVSLPPTPPRPSWRPTRPTAGYVLKCMLSPDVRQLATTSSDKTVKLWNLDGFTLDRTLAGGWVGGAGTCRGLLRQDGQGAGGLACAIVCGRERPV